MTPKATLRKALNVFDPRHSLQGRDLDLYYVVRPYAPLEPMKTYLRENRQHVKILFSGHRGSGKSTELAKLGKDLKKNLFVVPVSALELNLAWCDVHPVVRKMLDSP